MLGLCCDLLDSWWVERRTEVVELTTEVWRTGLLSSYLTRSMASSWGKLWGSLLGLVIRDLTLCLMVGWFRLWIWYLKDTKRHLINTHHRILPSVIVNVWISLCSNCNTWDRELSMALLSDSSGVLRRSWPEGSCRGISWIERPNSLMVLTPS